MELQDLMQAIVRRMDLSAMDLGRLDVLLMLADMEQTGEAAPLVLPKKRGRKPAAQTAAGRKKKEKAAPNTAISLPEQKERLKALQQTHGIKLWQVAETMGCKMDELLMITERDVATPSEVLKLQLALDQLEEKEDVL